MTLMTFEHVLFIFLYKTEMKHTILISFCPWMDLKQ